jgi:hypothetical protein
MREVDTGGDNYAWVISDAELTEEQALLAYYDGDEESVRYHMMAPAISRDGAMPELDAVSFTAARELDHGGRVTIEGILVTEVPLAARYITGGARGGDAYIGEWLYRNRRDAEHVVVVPADRSQVDPWWEKYEPGRVTVVEMPPGTTYRDRNAVLVKRADVVFGLPAYPEDHPQSRRSGTWQTIRMARRAGKLRRWDCVKPPYASGLDEECARS